MAGSGRVRHQEPEWGRRYHRKRDASLPARIELHTLPGVLGRSVVRPPPRRVGPTGSVGSVLSRPGSTAWLPALGSTWGRTTLPRLPMNSSARAALGARSRAKSASDVTWTARLGRFSRA